MPLLRVLDFDGEGDGRQSPAALRVRRGAGRLLRELGFGVVPEVTLPSGRRVDLAGIGTDGEILFIEVKSSLADFRADGKWPSYKAFCDRLYFASLGEVGDIFPPSEGLILTDGFDAEVVREAPRHPLPSKMRRAVTLRIAQTATRRLHEIEDPSPRLVVPG